jgi:Ni,Fe-hydrogenase III small subunit/ferredoxin
MAWILRGLRDGIVTSGYPKSSDRYSEDFRGTIAVTEVAPAEGDSESIEALCPTRAIQAGSDGGVHVDLGGCILCGRCVDARPDLFSFAPFVEPARLARSALVVPPLGEDEEALDRLREELWNRVGMLRRSIHVRHVDAGSDGSEEWEINALVNPVYDIQRLGIFFTATPRHADVLLVSGVGTAGMSDPLRRTYDAMPEPRVVIAVGTDAVSGGLVYPTYAAGPGIGSILPVDVWVPGSPPSPFAILHGILLGVGRLNERTER